MNQLINFSQIVSTKLCHDLAGPIGAVSNALEMLEFDKDDPDSMNLLKENAASLVSDLKFYRLMLGKVHESGIDLDSLHNIFVDFFDRNKFQLELSDNSEMHAFLIQSKYVQYIAVILYIVKQICYVGGSIKLKFYRQSNVLCLEIDMNCKKLIINQFTKDLFVEKKDLECNSENIVYFLAFELAKILNITLDFNYGESFASIKLSFTEWMI